MSEEPSDPEEASRGLDGTRQLLGAGGLVLAVLLVLGLGAALRVDPSEMTTPVAPPPPPKIVDEARSPAIESVSPPEAETNERSERSVEPETEVVPPPSAAAPSTLAARAKDDADRLAGSGSFTLQLLFACKDETVERFLKRAPGSSALRVLPAKGKDGCYRVCWGSYDSLQEAKDAIAGLPPKVRSGVAPRPAMWSSLLP